MIKTNTIRNVADVEAERAAAQAEATFKAERAAAVEASTVKVGDNTYNASERAISRMAEVVAATTDEADTLPISWSMADTPTGVMTEITLGELRAALKLAVVRRGELWGR